MSGDAPRTRRPRPIVLAAAVLTAAIAAVSVAVLLLGDAGASQTAVRVSPLSVLMTEPGQTRSLAATGIDAAGKPVEGGRATWSTNREATVSVAEDGTVTAVAPGSAQITAVIDGIRSAPVLVIVTKPADGVTLIDDAQVVVAPDDADPAAAPSAANHYRTTLRDVAPAVGDRLLGTGEQPIAGEVVDVAPSAAGTDVTLRVVPLHELLPGLLIEETFDLAEAAIEVPDEIRRLYDVTRAGTTLQFIPRTNFTELASARGTPVSPNGMPAFPPMAYQGPLSALASPQPTLGASEFQLGPFTCKFGGSAMPIQLSTPPTFSVELTPSLDIAYTPEDRLRRWVLTLPVEGKVDVGLTATAAFEGKLTCEAKLYTIQIPISGPLSIFLAGLIPVKAEVEVAGKLTLASMEIGADVSAKTTGRLGIVCTGPAGCAVDRDLSDVVTTFNPRLNGPDLLEDLRVEPTFAASISVEGAMGSPFLETLRLNLAKAKVGVELSGDWAPRAFQIRDAAYASTYKLSLEGGVSLGGQLGDIATVLGLGELTGLELKIEKDLAASPTGTLRPDRTEYVAGETGTARLELTSDSSSFLGLYNVREVLLVRFSAGSVTGLDAITATDGQTAFAFEFTAPATMQASELHAFVVTRLVPTDWVQMELGRALPRPPITITGVELFDTGVRACESGPGSQECREDINDGSPAWSGQVSIAGNSGVVSRQAEAALSYTLTYVDGQLQSVEATGSGESHSTGNPDVGAQSGHAETSIDFQMEFIIEGAGEIPFSLWIDFEAQSVGELDYVDCGIRLDGSVEWEYECDDGPGYSDSITGTLSEGHHSLSVDVQTSATSTQLVTWRNGGSGSFVLRFVLGGAAVPTPTP